MPIVTIPAHYQRLLMHSLEASKPPVLCLPHTLSSSVIFLLSWLYFGTNSNRIGLMKSGKEWRKGTSQEEGDERGCAFFLLVAWGMQRCTPASLALDCQHLLLLSQYFSSFLYIFSPWAHTCLSAPKERPKAGLFCLKNFTGKWILQLACELHM